MTSKLGSRKSRRSLRRDHVGDEKPHNVPQTMFWAPRRKSQSPGAEVDVVLAPDRDRSLVPLHFCEVKVRSHVDGVDVEARAELPLHLPQCAAGVDRLSGSPRATSAPDRHRCKPACPRKSRRHARWNPGHLLGLSPKSASRDTAASTGPPPAFPVRHRGPTARTASEMSEQRPRRPRGCASGHRTPARLRTRRAARRSAPQRADSSRASWVVPFLQWQRSLLAGARRHPSP